ncbi:predicted protein [Histoplasma capsulatum H143]|uniref:Uncharacterized protein n=1 Tax=Ajellomyces capsulatus (strain H143) TaxID=544712 RepID=C6HT07_AJECH|nr:predicted protein [Histoplasma capsulatum H143]
MWDHLSILTNWNWLMTLNKSFKRRPGQPTFCNSPMNGRAFRQSVRFLDGAVSCCNVLSILRDYLFGFEALFASQKIGGKKAQSSGKRVRITESNPPTPLHRT